MQDILMNGTVVVAVAVRRGVDRFEIHLRDETNKTILKESKKNQG